MGPEIFYGIGAIVLALGIGYGFWAYRTRNKANDAVTEAATREEYSHGAQYEARTKEQLKQQIR